MTSSNPLVSLIITTYNRQPLLAESLASALAQTYTPLEIIVVDDGSTDETLSFLAKVPASITVLEQMRGGVAAARNLGAQAAKGEWLTFLDDDDWLAPDKIAQQIALSQQQPAAGLIHCGYYLSDKSGLLKDKVWLWPPPNPLSQLLQGNPIWSGAPLIRRSVFAAAHGYDTTLTNGQDWDLWLRLALAEVPFAVLPQPLGSYRLQPDSMVTNLDKLPQAVLTVLDRAFAHAAMPAWGHALRATAYGNAHFWLSSRAYATSRWDLAQHHLRQALHHRPEWREQPTSMIPLWRNSALDVRVANPEQFVHDLLTHLPSEALFLAPHGPTLLGHVHGELALRASDAGQEKLAYHHWQQLMALAPEMTQKRATFLPLLVHHAMRLPRQNPIEAAKQAYGHIPATFALPAHWRAAMLGQLHLAMAFEQFALEQGKQTVRHVAAASLYSPAILVNRGVLSILLKSSWRWLRQTPSTP